MKKETMWTISVGRAATLLGISRASAYNAVRRGELPAIRVGGRVLVLRSGIERLLAGETQSPEANDDGRSRRGTEGQE